MSAPDIATGPRTAVYLVFEIHHRQPSRLWFATSALEIAERALRQRGECAWDSRVTFAANPRRWKVNPGAT
eukprot:2654606-Rhodomonas_salina.2